MVGRWVVRVVRVVVMNEGREESAGGWASRQGRGRIWQASDASPLPQL